MVTSQSWLKHRLFVEEWINKSLEKWFEGPMLIKGLRILLTIQQE